MTPRVRFFLFLLPRLLIGRCTPGRLAGYAVALSENGDERLAGWCWRAAARRAVENSYSYTRLLETCMHARQHETAEALAAEYFDRNGLELAEATRLIGRFVLAGGFAPALKLLQRLLQRCDNDLSALSPAPAPPRDLCGTDLTAKLEARVREGLDDPGAAGDLCLSLGRLCFSVGAFDTSTQLFECAGEQARVEPRDRIAAAYAALCSGQAHQAEALDLDQLGHSPKGAGVGADWQFLLATVLFARGELDSAAAAVEAAVRERFAGLAELEAVVADCRGMIQSLAGFPEALKLTENNSIRPTETQRMTAVRKIFVGGYGWSGSGAIYDALTEYEGLAEAPDNPVDRYVNAHTGNEMTFAQGPAGLGKLWLAAKQTQALTRRDLWDMLRWHVFGGGAIGYSEHKSARTAASLVQALGPEYTAAFRSMMQSLVSLRDGCATWELAGILTEATERLTRIITGAREGDCVIFNNAIFGTNVDMLDIFSNFRAAIVARDPLDQFADRRAQDIRQWMTASRFVPFYSEGRKAFQARRRSLRAEHADQVREVEFERFVLDAHYREGVLEWLLEGQDVRRSGRRKFEPERSARNIEISRRLLASGEREVLGKALRDWRRS